MVLNDLTMHVEWIVKIMCDGDLDMCRGFLNSTSNTWRVLKKIRTHMKTK
jgi:hypothetical protein